MRRQRATTLAGLAVACLWALAEGAHAQAPSGPAVAPHARLDLLSEDTMRVAYTLARPATAIALKRTPDDRRIGRWRPADDDFTLIHEKDEDRIVRRDGGAFREAAFEVPATYIRLPKDYAPFMPFTDGGLLVHSGRFQACAETCAPAPAAFPMTLVSPTDRRIIAFGETRFAAFAWDDAREGTMLYLGRALPVETLHVRAVVDEGLPADIRAALDALFPRMMAHFSARFGALARKPTMYVALDRDTQADGDPRSNRFSMQGGTLPGQVFMHLSGDGWLEAQAARAAAEMPSALAWFFAHEAAHLYQSERAHDAIEADAWIHEGGADALTALTLGELAMVDPGYLAKRTDDAAQTCGAGLRDRTLAEAGDAGAFDLYYACGMVVQLYAHNRLAERTAGGRGLFDLWAVYLDRVAAGAPWRAAPFLAVMEETAGQEAAVFARRVVAGGPDVTPEFLRVALAE